jgi:hypothetical protein
MEENSLDKFYNFIRIGGPKSPLAKRFSDSFKILGEYNAPNTVKYVPSQELFKNTNSKNTRKRYEK